MQYSSYPVKTTIQLASDTTGPQKIFRLSGKIRMQPLQPHPSFQLLPPAYALILLLPEFI